jgi:hypothetical protein
VAGDQEWAEPVEIVDDDASTTEIEGGRTVDWHAVLRTGAAVVVAASLLWAGRSYADQADAERRTACLGDVQNAYWRYEQYGYQSGATGSRGEPELGVAIIDDLVERARSCGADAYAEALDRTRPDEDD